MGTSGPGYRLAPEPFQTSHDIPHIQLQNLHESLKLRLAVLLSARKHSRPHHNLACVRQALFDIPDDAMDGITESIDIFPEVCCGGVGFNDHSAKMRGIAGADVIGEYVDEVARMVI